MGITFHEYKFLEYITENNSLGDILTLGRLEVILSKKDLLDLKLNNTLNENDKYAEKILKEVFKANSVSSLDNSKYENADEILDLNLPIHKILKNMTALLILEQANIFLTFHSV